MTIVAGTFPRHCERSEAIHSFFMGQHGLLRFARNDGEYSLAFSRRDMPSQVKRPVGACKRGYSVEQSARRKQARYH
jgi:hypothetical protein